MKKYYLLFIIFVGISGSVNSQSITNISISPSNPTTNDTIQILIECTFPSGGCEGSVISSAQIGNTIYADALHCMGMLTVICTDYDTVTIAPLSVGQYSFIYTLTAGQGPSCTPGIVPDDTDTLTFEVDDATGIKDNQVEFPFDIITTDSKIIIHNLTNENGVFSIFSTDGKLLISRAFDSEKFEIVRPETKGIYLLTVETKYRKYSSKVQLH